MITTYFTPLEAAINRIKASGGEVGNPEFLAEMDKAGVINLSRNTFEVGDTFTIPATRDDVVPFLVKDFLTNYPKSRITGQHPVDYSILVEVKNSKTGIHLRRFRVNDPCNSFKEYRREDDTYIPTGKIIGPQNELAEKLRPLNNQGARLDYLLGKTLRVENHIFGDAPIFTCGMITNICRRWLAEFIVVPDDHNGTTFEEVRDKTILHDPELRTQINKKETNVAFDPLTDKSPRTVYIAKEPIKVYKILQRKIPNRYNGYREGELRSFDNADEFKAYTLNSLCSSDLFLNKTYYEWVNDLKQEIKKTCDVGITSLLSMPTDINPRSWYKTFVCECTIPKDSRYFFMNDKNHFLSDRIIINKVIKEI